MPLPLIVGAAALLRGGMTAATLAPLIKPAIGVAKRFLTKAPVRPGVGSAVTKGPLMVGKQVLLGPKPGMSSAAKVAAAVGITGAGGLALKSGLRTGTAVPASRVATGAQPATSSRPSPRRSSPKATSTDRKCCPAGTKRMVCFKRGRVKDKPHASKPMAHRSRAKKKRRGAVTAKQKAARERFARAARKGPIRKGTRL